MTAKQERPGPLPDPQHERFAQGLAEFKTQIDAYAAAGYVPDNGNAARLAARVEIKARVRELAQEACKFADVRRERLVVDLDEIAQADIGLFYERVKVGGRMVDRMRDLTTLPPRQRRLIQSVKCDRKTGKVIEFTLKDGLAALTTLLKYMGGLPEAPTAPTLNIFSALSAEDQRDLADALEAASREKRKGEAPTSH